MLTFSDPMTLSWDVMTCTLSGCQYHLVGVAHLSGSGVVPSVCEGHHGVGVYPSDSLLELWRCLLSFCGEG